ncbi:MAG: hypothetical protein PHV77_03690 [Candidatus Omnitrophica bacterium]|nr:hypothetical protein [Candidatus Omnitrophota bacterium]
MTDSVEALMTATAEVLSVLLDFINEQFLPKKLPHLEKHALSEIRKNLNTFQKFVKKRLEQIKPKLEKVKKDSYATIVECPACYQEALVLGEEHPLCLFCGYSAEPAIVANKWIETILGINYYTTVKDGGYNPLYSCPECKEETLVDKGLSGSQFESNRYICFSCGSIWKESELDECLRCGELYEVQDDDFANAENA